jgi:hypothetical protein
MSGAPVSTPISGDGETGADRVREAQRWAERSARRAPFELGLVALSLVVAGVLIYEGLWWAVPVVAVAHLQLMKRIRLKD